MCYLSVLLSDFCFFPLRLLSLCSVLLLSLFFFFFKQKTAYEMRISDWSSDVCSSDLEARSLAPLSLGGIPRGGEALEHRVGLGAFGQRRQPPDFEAARSEEHTSELQSLMRISYAVFCLKKKILINK